MDDKAKDGLCSNALLAQMWGQSLTAVSNDLQKFGMSAKTHKLSEINVKKIDALRRSASGYGSENMEELKIIDLQKDIELKEIKIANEIGALVAIDVLEPLLMNVFVSARARFQSVTQKIIDDVELTYGVKIDKAIIESHIEDALAQLSTYSKVLENQEIQDDDS